jgi:hypothetical protein
MHPGRTRSEKVAVTIAVAAAVWVLGAATFYGSGGINTSGLLPTAGCLLALWGAMKADIRLMWFGTGVVTLSALVLLFSVGLVVAPAAIALVLGSVVLGGASQSRA